MTRITYSAPAKVILSGEHAVVYGKPALVSALDLRLKFSLWESIRTEENRNVQMIGEKVREYLGKRKIGIKKKHYVCSIESDIPVKQRLGSSAAFCVAGTAAFLEYFSGREFDRETVNNLAYGCEKFFHINASGVDVSASCYGGLIFYRKEFEFLKNISALNFKIPNRIENGLYLIDSGNPVETTGFMVNDVVGKNYNKSPGIMDEVLNDIEKTTKRMVVSIIKDDVEFFAKTIIDNQIFLEMLGVVSKNTKNLLKKLERFGVGKVTGGGGKKAGSGFLFFYANKQRDLEMFLKKEKITFYKFKQDYKGLRRESSASGINFGLKR